MATIINEYLDVSRRHSTTSAEKGLVNGLLDAIAKVARPA